MPVNIQWKLPIVALQVDHLAHYSEITISLVGIHQGAHLFIFTVYQVLVL